MDVSKFVESLVGFRDARTITFIKPVIIDVRLNKVLFNVVRLGFIDDELSYALIASPRSNDSIQMLHFAVGREEKVVRGVAMVLDSDLVLRYGGLVELKVDVLEFVAEVLRNEPASGGWAVYETKVREGGTVLKLLEEPKSCNESTAMELWFYTNPAGLVTAMSGAVLPLSNVLMMGTLMVDGYLDQIVMYREPILITCTEFGTGDEHEEPPWLCSSATTKGLSLEAVASSFAIVPAQKVEEFVEDLARSLLYEYLGCRCSLGIASQDGNMILPLGVFLLDLDQLRSRAQLATQIDEFLKKIVDSATRSSNIVM